MLEVSNETYEEIERLLKSAGYDHVFGRYGIDMHGVGLAKAQPNEQRRRRLAVCLCLMNPDMSEENAYQQADILLDVWDAMRLPAEGTHQICQMVNDRCVICGRQ
jgi:hypothetical protein